MASIHDCSQPAELLSGIRLARTAVGRGELVVLPTDTVYGVGADAFSGVAVQRLLDAKGRDRQSPPPVLVPGLATLDALAEPVPELARRLVDALWPGGLTLVLRARASLDWDLGETRGTVAVRMPDHPLTLELLESTGPMAVSSANRTGEPAALTAAEAQTALGDSVSVYLDAGPVGERYPESARLGSTIVDATAADGGGGLRILRHGVVSDAELIAIVGESAIEATG